MANYGQGENRNSSYGMGGVPRTYNASPPPFGEVQDSGGSESDSGGGQDLQCYAYSIGIDLTVYYNNVKGVEDLLPGDNYVELEFKILEYEAEGYECKKGIDLPPGDECERCMYSDPTEDFTGSICGTTTKSLSNFVHGPGPWVGSPPCTPESKCDAFYLSCWAHYSLECKKFWQQCGKNEMVHKMIKDLGGEVDGPVPHAKGTLSTEGNNKGNMVVPWTVLKLIDAWKAASKTPGKAGSEEKPCDICEFLCCLVNSTILSEDTKLPKLEDCRVDGMWGSGGWLEPGAGTRWHNPNWDPCAENVGNEFENWLLNSAEEELTICRRNPDNPGPYEDYQHPCPGCCGEDDLGF